MGLAWHIAFFPHDLALGAEPGDLDLKLRRRGADMDRDGLPLRHAPLAGITFDEQRDRISRVEKRDGKKAGKNSVHETATGDAAAGFHEALCRKVPGVLYVWVFEIPPSPS